MLEEGAQITPRRDPATGTHAIGHVTSAYWSPTVRAPIAMALVEGGRALTGQTVFVPMPGGAIPAASSRRCSTTAKGSASMAELAIVDRAGARRPGAGALVSVGAGAARDALLVPGRRRGRRSCAAAFGCALPVEACRAAEAGERAALWLGPDEWLLLAPEAETAALFATIEAALGAVPHALVDVSHRQVGFAVAGRRGGRRCSTPAARSTSTRRPSRSASAPAPCWRNATSRCGARRRTLFRLEVNRTFADYVAAYLRVAERGLG